MIFFFGREVICSVLENESYSVGDIEKEFYGSGCVWFRFGDIFFRSGGS